MRLNKTYKLQEKIMIHGYELVHPVLEKHRGLPSKLAGITDKTDDWYRSHGYEPKTINPAKNGNLSAVDHYLRMVRLYEAGADGAGRMLNTLVNEAVQTELAELHPEHSQPEIHDAVISEHCDVSRWLAKTNIDTASPNDLAVFERECTEAIQSLSEAMAKARAARRRREVVTNGNGVKR